MNYVDFTPAFKDRVLKWLCEECVPYKYCYVDWKPITKDSTLLNTCLHQFKKLGLVDDFNVARTGVLSVTLTADALDLLSRGGFVFIADRYVKDLEKANLELEKLKAKPGLKKYVEQISGVTGIITDLISAAITITG